MNRSTSLEAWMFIALIVGAIIAIVVVGWLAMKVYRKLKPFEEVDPNAISISLSNSVQYDGFIKILFVGLVLTSPALYYLYVLISEQI